MKFVLLVVTIFLFTVSAFAGSQTWTYIESKCANDSKGIYTLPAGSNDVFTITLNDDGTYVERYIFLDGRCSYKSSGRYSLKDDQLTMTTEKEENKVDDCGITVRRTRDTVTSGFAQNGNEMTLTTENSDACDGQKSISSFRK